MEFEEVKCLIRARVELSAFDPLRKVYLYTDASYDGGFGYILVQYDEHNNLKIIQCGSTGIKPEQCNYSVCELDKYSWYLAGGKPFTIYTDNRALSRLENINIEKVKNSHVMHILEDLLGYNFVVKHVCTGMNRLADFFSKNPCQGTEAPFYPRLIKPTLFTNSSTVNRVHGGEVVDMTILHMAEMG